MKRTAAVVAAILVVGTTLFITIRPERGDSRVLMCPGPDSTHVFQDARKLCASQATALARIDGDGAVRFLADPDSIPCSIPTFSVVDENTTRVMGHGKRRCDTDTGNEALYVFPHCSLAMNYPGNEDYRAGLPIGLLVDPYDC